jgi:hypothetical protein
MDLQILQNQHDGLVAAGKKLREKEALFLKAQGLDERIAKSQKEIIAEESELVKITKDLALKITEKNEAVAGTITALAEKMGEVLPEGEAILDITDGRFLIGWKKDGSLRAYSGLSGGEKVTFDSALDQALGCGIIVQESAELDKNFLLQVIEKLTSLNKQVIVNSCHPPAMIPKGWNAVSL